MVKPSGRSTISHGKGYAESASARQQDVFIRRKGATMVNTKSIDEVLSRATEAKEVPGVVAVAATDQGAVYEGAFGKRELGKDAPMTLDTVVWIASMTKAVRRRQRCS